MAGPDFLTIDRNLKGEPDWMVPVLQSPDVYLLNLILLAGAIDVHPGKRLRQMREQLGLTVRDVEAASGRLASKRGNSAYSIPLSRFRISKIKKSFPAFTGSIRWPSSTGATSGRFWPGTGLTWMRSPRTSRSPPCRRRIRSIA